MDQYFREIYLNQHLNYLYRQSYQKQDDRLSDREGHDMTRHVRWGW